MQHQLLCEAPTARYPLVRSRQYGARSAAGKRRCSMTITNCSNAMDDAVEMDRRRFLLSSSSSAAAMISLGLLDPTASFASPIQTGQLSACTQATLPRGAAPVNCCPPPGASTTVVDFTFNTGLPMRTRPAAHLVDAAYVAKYTRAYELLKALPDSDPRRFSQQANVHCAYCNGAFVQADGRSSLQIHNNWLFLPWHRWYLYFHERILAKLLGDDTFALPYWNWDNQDSAGPQLPNVIPAMYLRNGALFDGLRESRHLPPKLTDLNYSGNESRASDRQQRADNNALLYQQVVSGARTPSLFMGLPYRAGDADAPGGGSLESAPHGPVHVWTGSRSQPNGEDMGTLYAAARDPIFFAHHANIDRIWNVWKGLGGRRQDFTDPDWLQATFLFYDENSRLVRVRVADAVSSDKLSYRYQDTGNAWLTARPSILARASQLLSSSPDAPSAAAAGVLHDIKDHVEDDIEEFGEKVAGKFKKLESNYRSRVKRPLKTALGRLKSKLREDEDVEEVLVIEGVEIECEKATKFDVFINYPEANENTPTNVIEYAGTFVNVPHFGMHPGGKRESTLRIGIGDTLEQLGVTDSSEIIVTLVPKGDGKRSPVIFKGIKIEYE